MRTLGDLGSVNMFYIRGEVMKVTVLKKVGILSVVGFVMLSIQACSASNHSTAFEQICEKVDSAQQVLDSSSDSLTPSFVQQDRILIQAEPLENRSSAASQSGSGTTLQMITNLFSGSDDLATKLTGSERKEFPELTTLEQETNGAYSALFSYLTAPEALAPEAQKNWLLSSQDLKFTLSKSQFDCSLN